MQFVLVSLTDEPYLDFDYPSFHVLGFFSTRLLMPDFLVTSCRLLRCQWMCLRRMMKSCRRMVMGPYKARSHR